MDYNEENKTFVAFDLETTGVDTGKDRIVQYCFIKLTPNGDHGFDEEVKTALVNPGIPIPKGASDVHGITDDIIKEKKPHLFSVIAPYILPWIEGSTFIHFNGRNFDVPLLATEFERAGIKNHGLYDMPGIDAMILYREYRSHSLIAAAKDVCNVDIEETAHDAEVDVQATISVVHGLRKLMGLSLDEMASKSIPEGSVDFAGKLKLDEEGEVIYAIGKNKGDRVKDEPGFGRWMLKNDFPNQTKIILKQLLK